MAKGATGNKSPDWYFNIERQIGVVVQQEVSNLQWAWSRGMTAEESSLEIEIAGRLEWLAQMQLLCDVVVIQAFGDQPCHFLLPFAQKVGTFGI